MKISILYKYVCPADRAAELEPCMLDGRAAVRHGWDTLVL